MPHPTKTLKSALLVWLAGVLFVANLTAAALEDRPLAVPASARPVTSNTITHGPFLQAPSDTGVTISWATSRRCVSWVEYRPEASARWLTNTPARHGLVDADVTVHNVPLTGLEPGTTYRYRAVSREIVEFKGYKVTFAATVASEERRFTTLDSRQPATSFVVLNDRHEKVVPLAASLAGVAWAGVDLVFFNGDMVNSVKDEAQLYQCVVAPCAQSFAGRIPLVYVRGNHDTRGSFARRLLDYFPTASGGYYYTIRQGPVVLLVLDGGEDKGDGDVEYHGLVDFEPYLRAEVEWLKREIETPAFRDAPFRICIMHIPPGNRPNPRFVRPKWLFDNVLPLLNRGRVDLLLCGHIHRYAIHPAGQDGRDFPMVIGGAETVIRCDVTDAQIRISSTDLSGQPLPQPPPIGRRGRK
jgi:acid phosphatase type 7